MLSSQFYLKYIIAFFLFKQKKKVGRIIKYGPFFSDKLKLISLVQLLLSQPDCHS